MQPDEWANRGEAARHEANEATKIVWHDPRSVRELLYNGKVHDGLSFAALSYALAFNAI